MWRRGTSALSRRLALSEEVIDALYGANKKPIVALESTIISHGMPFPQNLEMAKHVETIVRAQGACPATICIADGQLKVGLSENELKRLAETGFAARKCSTRDIPAAIAENILGATTVSSTMRIAHAAGIKVFVTGGIGGVHRFSEDTMDVSTDLMELARTPVAVVCAGIKSILDIPKTLEYLETHAVPVVAYQQDEFPAFFTRDSGVKAHLRKDTAQECAELIHESLGLELPNGFVFAVPNPNPVAARVIDDAIKTGLEEVKQKIIQGQAVTPYLLKRLNEITGGVSLGSNIDLVNNNAKIGSQIACALFQLEQDWRGPRPIMSFASTECEPSSKSARVLVVGGLVLDIISSASSPILQATSNIGTIQQTSGGVGRNVAECLLRLGKQPLLVSNIGRDSAGSILMDNMKTLGLNSSGIRVVDDLATAVYSAVLCNAGDLDVAIADMRALDAIDTSSIDSSVIKEAGFVIADGNLSPASLKDLFQRCHAVGVDVWFEPTSVQKSLRVIDGRAVNYMTYVSPNADELAAMSEAVVANDLIPHDSPFEDFELSDGASIIPPERMAHLKNDILTVLLAMANGNKHKEKHIVVTMGKHGVLLGSINMNETDVKGMLNKCNFPSEVWGVHDVRGHSVCMVHLPGYAIQVKNCTGAGDSLVGGTVYGLLNGRDVFTSCHYGMIAARHSLVSEHAINPNLHPGIFEEEDKRAQQQRP